MEKYRIIDPSNVQVLSYPPRLCPSGHTGLSHPVVSPLPQITPIPHQDSLAVVPLCPPPLCPSGHTAVSHSFVSPLPQINSGPPG